MKLEDTDGLKGDYGSMEQGKDEYIWIHATGTGVTEAGDAMLKQELALTVVVLSDYSWQKYLKDGKVKSNGCSSIVLLVKQDYLDEVMNTLRLACECGLYAYALPVLATEVVQPLSMKEILFGR